MQVCGRHFSSELIERIQATVDAEPSLSRLALSRQVCEWEGWRAPNGNLQDLSCRKALAALNARGVLTLPECTSVYSFQQPSASAKAPLPELPEIHGELAELGEVSVVPVSSRYSKSSPVWNGLMSEFHYLGNGPLCGAQIRYLVESSRFGWLGGLSFSAATWQLADRDEWIGWSERARRAHLRAVVCNSRFLILPSVSVPNLASHVLSQSLSRLPADWHARYGYEPVLVETFVDPRRFTGACYRASNWVLVGQTKARPTPFANGKVPDGVKDIYVHALRKDWQALLCEEPERGLCLEPRLENPQSWVEEEFGRVELYDERLKTRLFTVAGDFFAQPGALVPQACNGSEAKTKGAYRLLQNPRVDLKTILKPHTEATVVRMQEQAAVLAPQDTSLLNYTAHREAVEGLGPLNTKSDGSVGLILHDTLAFTEAGVPLGLLDVQCWARDPAEAGKREKRKSLPIEAKESMKWLTSYRAASAAQVLCPDTMVVSIGDRESDIYELFAEAAKNPQGAELLVRAEYTRNRQVEEMHLWDKMQREPIAGDQEVYLPRRADRPARTAKLAVRYAQVTLAPPKGKDLPAVTVWAVYAREVEQSPHVKKPVRWMLLTTVKTNSFKAACKRIEWYSRRWGIEVYHRTLKSGCRIQDRGLGTAERIETCLAIDLVVAWRVYLLTQQGRETPELPCDVYLAEEEWQALHAYVKKASPPDQPLTLREAVRMIASLGGFLGRKCDGEPGTTVMWRGLQRLADITEGFICGRLHPIRAGP